MLSNCDAGEDSSESLGLHRDEPWIFIGRTDAEAEAPILWPPEENWLNGKDPDAGNDWWQNEKEVAEHEMVR